eukprot:m.155627 g.155627  ORF g.155627 m.155627 type:complete len:185 (-) comp24659_c1_seq2:48-602(-)
MVNSMQNSPNNNDGQDTSIESNGTNTSNSFAPSQTQPFKNQHVHGPGCGHPVVIHLDHLDFLDSSGELHRPTKDGQFLVHSWEADSNPPQVLRVCRKREEQLQLCSTPLESGACHNPHTHHNNHKHGPDCGHMPIRHGDHLDYIVDSLLHCSHKDHCDVYGPVEKHLNRPGTSETLNDLLKLCM